ncbi:anti-sigma factor [Kitasatospora sp. DSM 101779]|uniref:anti-sigma factor n=1 Tax=Kitasatospora sp. DSM 101779 TaxID=2853165 RepID=UPI0021D8A273|nr:anti-sigma factor [Kitasatospora sp. DSM 101779]MCU7821225.1 anti-sigma factor [Kitasatospora sp. DSM 101779]
MTGGAELHTLTGAYAAHALDGPERAEFERHLALCEACALEVREFAATLARLGAAEAETPPAELRARVMSGIGSVRQLAPPSAVVPVVPQPTGRRRRSRLVRHWPKLALAASVALAAALGGLAVDQSRRADEADARATQLQAQQAVFGSLLTAPDARTATATAGTGVGTVVWSQSRGQAGFLASGMPALPAGKTYELWFDDAGTMRPAGLLPASSGSLLLQGPLDGAVGVGVTVEPAGGSAHPSSTPVMLLPFS